MGYMYPTIRGTCTKYCEVHLPPYCWIYVPHTVGYVCPIYTVRYVYYYTVGYVCPVLWDTHSKYCTVVYVCPIGTKYYVVMYPILWDTCTSYCGIHVPCTVGYVHVCPGGIK